MTKSLPISKRMMYNSYLKVVSKDGSAGIDKQSIDMLNENLSDNLYRIWNRMTKRSLYSIQNLSANLPLIHPYKYCQKSFPHPPIQRLSMFEWFYRAKLVTSSCPAPALHIGPLCINGSIHFFTVSYQYRYISCRSILRAAVVCPGEKHGIAGNGCRWPRCISSPYSLLAKLLCASQGLCSIRCRKLIYF